MLALVVSGAPVGPAVHADTVVTKVKSCQLVNGWTEVASRRPRFIVFGELHGTQQSPKFVGNLACALASSGQSVLVAVEHDSAVDAAMQRAWTLPPQQFARALAKLDWSGRTDGVASRAVFDMVTDLQRLSRRGLPISVVAFNGAKDQEQARRFAHLPGQGPHEAAQAENIRAAAAAGAYSFVLVLVGNFHANTSEVNWGEATFDPMARQLARFGRVVTLDMHYADGTAWNCQLRPGVKPVAGQPISQKDMDCSIHPAMGTDRLGAEQSIRLRPVKENGRTYDGQFWLGAITGSPPAVP